MTIEEAKKIIIAIAKKLQSLGYQQAYSAGAELWDVTAWGDEDEIIKTAEALKL